MFFLKKIPFLLILLFFTNITLYSIPPVKVVDKELDDAEQEFQRAKKMFNPWYAGPLLTGSAHTLDPGLVNLQPYFFVIDNYASYNSSGKSHSISNKIVLNPLIDVQIGLNSRMDTSIEIQGIYNQKNSKSYFNIGDTSLSLSLGILKEEMNIPAIKVSIQESFPTGNYQKFSSTKTDISDTGSGTYTTSFGLNAGKVIWWWLTHPMSLRLALSYSIPTNVHVKGYNAYGGGIGTDGKVNVGNSCTAGFGYELSLTQKFVFSLDLDYEHGNKSTFKGILGQTITGDKVIFNNPKNYVFSLAPALEYNFTENISLIGGMWFSAFGKNTYNFLSGILTLTATF